MVLKDKRQTEKNRSLIQSIAHAMYGVKDIFLRERNFRYHCLIAVLVVGCGLAIHLSLMEWIAIVVCIGAMFVAETFNSAIERLADFACNGKYQFLVKQAKDAASAAVLLTAVFTVLIGLLVFAHHFF